jgi:phage gp29-like protein
VGKYPRNVSNSKRNQMKQFLEKLGSNGYGLFPQGMEVQLIESNKSGTITTYQDFIKKGQNQESKLILGESDTTGDRRTGSYARTVVMNGIRMDIMQNVASISAKGYQGLVEKGLRLNYGDDFERHLMPKIKPILLNSQNAKEHAEAAQIAQQSGVPVPESYYYEKTLGVEKPKTGQTAVVNGQMFTVGVDPTPEPLQPVQPQGSGNTAPEQDDSSDTGEGSVANN